LPGAGTVDKPLSTEGSGGWCPGCPEPSLIGRAGPSLHPDTVNTALPAISARKVRDPAAGPGVPGVGAGIDAAVSGSASADARDPTATAESSVTSTVMGLLKSAMDAGSGRTTDGSDSAGIPGSCGVASASWGRTAAAVSPTAATTEGASSATAEVACWGTSTATTAVAWRGASATAAGTSGTGKAGVATAGLAGGSLSARGTPVTPASAPGWTVATTADGAGEEVRSGPASAWAVPAPKTSQPTAATAGRMIPRTMEAVRCLSSGFNRFAPLASVSPHPRTGLPPVSREKPKEALVWGCQKDGR
jgi:hypothetical protein